MPEALTPQPRRFALGGFWGSHIEWITKVPEERDDGRYMRCWGHHAPRPRIADILTSKMESGKVGEWEFTEVDYERDPDDMFFGWVRFVGYEAQTATDPASQRTPNPLLTTQDLRI